VLLNNIVMPINSVEINKRIREIFRDNDINEFRQFIRNNNLQIKDLNNENFDILVFSIENDASINIIEYIICKCKYKTLNYIVNEYPEYKRKTPLLSAIGRSNFKVANYLIEYGADINYIVNDERKQILNIYKNVKYVLYKGMNLSFLINEFIMNNENYFLFYIFNYFIYSNDYILKFLKHYKKRIVLTNKKLEGLLNNRIKEIEFNRYIYETAIYYNNYEAIAILYDNDPREHNLIINDFCYIFTHSSINKTEFINKLKNPELKIQVNKKFLDDLENIVTDNEKKEHIFSLIKNNNINELKEYLEKYNIHLNIQDENIENQNHIIKYCIENNVSLSMINFLIKYCNYTSFNYNFYMNVNGKSSTLLYSFLLKNQYKYFDFFIKKGADINYGAILTCLYEDKIINTKNLKYILNNNFKLKVIFINQLISDHQNRLLKNIIKQYIYNDFFILKLLTIYKNKTSISSRQIHKILNKEKNKIEFDKSIYEAAFKNDNYDILNFLYKMDWREKDIIFDDLFFLLKEDQKNNHSIKKFIFLEKINSNELNLPIDKKFLNNLETLEDKRKIVVEYIKMKKILELKNYMEENHLSFSFFNNEEYDLLIYAITINVSLEMIKFIIPYYRTLDYYIHTHRSYKSPLFCALSVNNFAVADILIKYGASINYKIHNKDIIYQLYYYRRLNSTNLIYILNHGFELTSELIEALMNRNINNFSENYNNDIINNISKYYTLDNGFILNLLSFYKYKLSLSNQQLQALVMYKTNKISISYKCYYEALCNNNNNAINWFFNHIRNEPKVYLDDIEINELLHKAAEKNNYIFIERLFKSKIFHFNNIIEMFLGQIYMSVIFGNVNIDFIFFFLKKLFSNKNFNLKNIRCDFILVDLSRFQNYELMKLFIKKLLSHKAFDFNIIISFEHFFNIILEMDNVQLIEFFINESLKHKTFNLNNINIEKTFHYLMVKKNVELMQIYIKKSLSHETFDFNKINFDDILLIVSQFNDSELMILIIEKIINHETFVLNKIKIGRDLLILRQLDDNILVLEYFIKELFKCKQFLISYEVFETILLTASKIEDNDFMKFIIEKLVNHKTFNKNNMKIKKILLIADKLNDEEISRFYIETIMSNKFLELNYNNIEKILLAISEMKKISLIEFIIENIFIQERFNYRSFDINSINFNKIMVSANQNGNSVTLKYIINQLLNINDIRMINFENIKLSKFKKD